MTHAFDPDLEAGRHTLNLGYTFCWKDNGGRKGVCLFFTCLPLTCQHMHSFSGLRAYFFRIPAETSSLVGLRELLDSCLDISLTASHCCTAAFNIYIKFIYLFININERDSFCKFSREPLIHIKFHKNIK